MNGTHPPKEAFDLGLAISGATLLHGQTRTQDEIACFISAAVEVMTGEERKPPRSMVYLIEQRALKKLRHPDRIKRLR